MLHKVLWPEFLQKWWGTFRKITQILRFGPLFPLLSYSLSIIHPAQHSLISKSPELRIVLDSTLIQVSYRRVSIIPAHTMMWPLNFSQLCQFLNWCNIREHFHCLGNISNIESPFLGTTYTNPLCPLLCLHHVKEFSMYLGKFKYLSSSSSVVCFPRISMAS